MAFSLQYLAKVGLSLQYDKTYNPATGASAAPIPQMWMYNASSGGANDSTATVEGSGYFNGANGYLGVGDVIYVYTNNPGYHFLNVATNSSGTVTTAAIV